MGYLLAHADSAAGPWPPRQRQHRRWRHQRYHATVPEVLQDQQLARPQEAAGAADQLSSPRLWLCAAALASGVQKRHRAEAGCAAPSLKPIGTGTEQHDATRFPHMRHLGRQAEAAERRAMVASATALRRPIAERSTEVYGGLPLHSSSRVDCASTAVYCSLPRRRSLPSTAVYRSLPQSTG